MSLTPIDDKHFYLNDQLIDLVWIGYQAKLMTNAANYHDMNRSLNWLNKLARRLTAGQTTVEDESQARRRLLTLGLDWYLKEPDSPRQDDPKA